MAKTIFPDYELAYIANGQLAGEMIRGFLEAQGIPAMILQESAGVTYGFTYGLLGDVRVYVPAARLEEAKKLLEAMDAGEFAAPGEQDAPPEDEDSTPAEE